jgi:hypothetical protein
MPAPPAADLSLSMVFKFYDTRLRLEEHWAHYDY